MAEQNNYGSFVPTTSVWDVGPILEVDVTSPQFKELLVRMYQNLNLMSNVLNVKDTGYYNTLEYVCGQLYFPNQALGLNASLSGVFRQVFRTVIDFGALPNAGIKSVPHELIFNESTVFTRLYGTASDTTGLTYIPIPYSSAAAITGNIELSVDVTNVNITTGSDRTNYDTCVVVLEYLKY